MADISAKLVMELRARTGSAMMDCKKALLAVGGDIEKAVEEMRKSGLAKADKKADRVAAEGVVVAALSPDHKTAILMEVNCETDFVGRDSHFLDFVDRVAKKALVSGKNSVADVAEVVLEGAQTIDMERKALVAKLGENISLRRMLSLQTPHHFAHYIHGGRIGVIVEMEGGDHALAKDIAMHIAALNPMVVSAENVPAEILEKERAIFVAQTQDTGKSPEIVEKMVEGRIRKYLQEVSLEGQPFVKDPSLTVLELLKQHQAKVLRFDRFVVGEGIEKKEVDFVAEVKAAQAASK